MLLSESKQLNAFLFLTSCVICGLAVATVTASKVVHIVVDFPFSNLVFSVLTYPLVDCICELWGRKAAQRVIVVALFSQLLIAVCIQMSISLPSADFWLLQSNYEMILSSSRLVVFASLLAFAISQLLDVVVYQRLKRATAGKKLWLRTNVSTIMGQAIDSVIFINIVYFNSFHKLSILFGSILVKIVISIIMTPVVYLIVCMVHRYLHGNSMAFNGGIDRDGV